MIEVSGLAVTEAAGAKPVGQLWKNKVSAAWSAEDAAYEGGASGGGHCWNCGGVGHTKADCPHPPSGLTRGQIRRRRKFANRRPFAQSSEQVNDCMFWTAEYCLHAAGVPGMGRSETENV